MDGTPATRDELDRLHRFFAGIVGQSGYYAKVTVSVQDGRVGLVHVDQTYRVQQLPTTSGT